MDETKPGRRTIVRVFPDGRIHFIDSPDMAGLKASGATTKRRASHVEPARRVWRWIFHALRRTFGEEGRAASLTRALPVYWRVNMTPSGGGIFPELYCDRDAAIAAEVHWLIQNHLGRPSN